MSNDWMPPKAKEAADRVDFWLKLMRLERDAPVREQWVLRWGLPGVAALLDILDERTDGAPGVDITQDYNGWRIKMTADRV